jgi:hypothetical protein
VLPAPVAFPPDDYLLNKAQLYEVRRSDTRRAMTRLFMGFKSGLR